MVTLPLTID